MKKSICITGVILLVLALSKVNAQFASDNISNYAKQMKQQSPVSQANVHHNTLTASNTNHLPSNLASRNSFQQKIPANMRARIPAQAQNIPRNKPRMLASNSPKLRQKEWPKRPPALPVVY